MRWWILSGLAFLVASCAQRPPAKIAGDGELVLELGGSNRSLSASLRALGVELLPPRAAPEPAEAELQAAAEPEGDAPAHGEGDDGNAPRDGAESPPAGEAAAWIEVRLAAKETLMDLAKEHLGSGRRFQEIMALNGWNDRDARRLKVGQVVKIPRVAPK